ncbi:MAG: Cof-type HAD-IIB family hydrolase [Planctomycetota bacterium]|nr:Cof-type HAD-IIB family hydrolase [Planctomycetota bacterium]
MNRPRLIALDLDGTLLDREHAVSPRATAAIEALHGSGSEVILLTGRPPRMTWDYVRALGLEHAIVYNGASRYDLSRHACEHHHQLTRDAACEVMARLRAAHEGIGLGMETHHGWYLDPTLEERRKAAPRQLSSTRPDGVGPLEDFVEDAVIKVFARHPVLDAPGMASALEGLDVYVTWSGAGLLEVMHPTVNKREALERFAALRGVARADVAAMGDQHNDREVLAWVGHGVAMGNATEAVQAAADEVTLAHDEDGVAVVLERWLAP